MKSTARGAANNRKPSSPYNEAAGLLNRLLFAGSPRCSFKSLVYGSSTGSSNKNKKNSSEGTPQLQCSKRTYAIVSEVMKHRTVLEDVVDRMKKDDKGVVVEARNQGLLLVLLHELLLSRNQTIQGGGALKRKLMQNEASLREALERVDSTQNQGKRRLSGVSIQHNRHPRYVRINTLQTTRKEVYGLLQNHNNGKGVECYADAHVPDLLVIHPDNTKHLLEEPISEKQQEQSHNKPGQEQQSLLSLASLLRNKIVLQDKSSCFPAYCLVHGFSNKGTRRRRQQQEGDYLDACAAPGNKTSHLAALLYSQQHQERGASGNGTSNDNSDEKKFSPTTVFALDKCPRRAASLKQRMKQLIGDSQQQQRVVRVVTKEQDFLATTAKEYSSVTSILLDPTCSGSGCNNDTASRSQTANTNGSSTGTAENTGRITALSNFQTYMLRHAMQFPACQRIVYSTCSVHEQENESVIARCLYNSSNKNNEGNSSNSIQDATTTNEQQQEAVTNKSSENSDRHSNPPPDDEEGEGGSGSGSDSDNGGDSSGSSPSSSLSTDTASSACLEWQVVAPACLDHWPRRGRVVPPLTAEQASCMIRVDPHHDETTGFFVCCLERKSTRNRNEKTQSECRTTNNTTTRAPAEENESGCIIPVYGGQFSSSPLEKNKPAAKPSTTNTTEPAIRAANEQSSSCGKRRSRETKKRNADAALMNMDGDKEQPPCSSSRSSLSRKRAKKLQWKQRQRQSKLDRLKKKQEESKTSS